MLLVAGFGLRPASPQDVDPTTLVMPPLRTGDQARVELGCGKNKAIGLDDLVGVDWHPFESVDILTNLDEFPDTGGWEPPGVWHWAEGNSCSLVVTHQTLEHLQNLIPAMNEIHRICDASAFVEIVVPYGVGKAAIQDPTHVRFFTEMTFQYWGPGFVEAFGDYGIRGYFAVCGQDWREDGNMWTLLHPLKQKREVECWEQAKEASKNGLVTWPAPQNLLDRAPMLLGDEDWPQ